MITLVLCDDHAVVRKGVGMILKAEQDLHLIGEAKDGQEAITQVHELKPDILLVDLCLPKIHGLEVIHQVRAQTKSKCIAFTMFSSHSYMLEAVCAGASGYILKDSTLKELLEGIRKVAEGGTYFSFGFPDKLVSKCIRIAKARKYNDPLDELTQRELQVFNLAVQGLNNSQISSKLSINVRTVETHRSHLLEKLWITSQTDLIRFAVRRKM